MRKPTTTGGIAKGFLGDHRGTIADFDRAIELKPDYADAYTSRGFTKFIQGNYYGAIADYSQTIALNPDYVDAYINRGFAKSELGRRSRCHSGLEQGH